MTDTPRPVDDSVIAGMLTRRELDPIHVAAYNLVLRRCRDGAKGVGRTELSAVLERGRTTIHRVCLTLVRLGLCGQFRDRRSWMLRVDVRGERKEVAAPVEDEPPEHMSELKWAKPGPGKCCMTCGTWYPGKPGMVHSCTCNRHPRAGKSPGEVCTYYTERG